MANLPILEQLPPVYRVQKSRGGAVALHADVADAFLAAGYGPREVGPLQDSDLVGRRSMHELVVEGRRYVVRRFSHGGLLRWLTGSRFLDAERPFREVLLAEALTRAGLPTPQVVAARARRSRAGGWRLDVVTRRIEDSVNLSRALFEMAERGVTRATRTAILAAAGDLVRRMHDAGFLHADLTPSNLLLGRGALLGQPTELWVLDLDRSEMGEKPLEPSRRVANLSRLLRHVLKHRDRGGLPVVPADLGRFLGGYEPVRSHRAQLWQGVRARYERSRPVHSVAWALDRRGPGSTPGPPGPPGSGVGGDGERAPEPRNPE